MGKPGEPILTEIEKPSAPASDDDFRPATKKELIPKVKRIWRFSFGLFTAESGRWTSKGKFRPLISIDGSNEKKGLFLAFRKWLICVFYAKSKP